MFVSYLSFSQLEGNQTYVDGPGAPVRDRRRHGGSETGVGGQRKAQGDGRQSQGVVHLHWTGGYSAESLRGQTQMRAEHRDEVKTSFGSSSVGMHLTMPTVIRPDSVRFQKDFQNCMLRFWVMRSNSAPRSSGSMTYLPDVRRESAAMPGREQTSTGQKKRQKRHKNCEKNDLPKPDCCLPNVSPYETMLMTTVCRNGRKAGENCQDANCEHVRATHKRAPSESEFCLLT